jgi:hypothetical protein
LSHHKVKLHHYYSISSIAYVVAGFNCLETTWLYIYSGSNDFKTMNNLTLYHGTITPYNQVDPARAARTPGVAGPAFYTSCALREATNAVRGEQGIILVGEFDPSTFSIFMGREKPETYFSKEKLAEAIRLTLQGLEKQAAQFLSKRPSIYGMIGKTRGVDSIEKDIAEFVWIKSPVILSTDPSSDGYRGENFVGTSFSLFRMMLDDYGPPVGEAWHLAEKLFQNVGMDAVDVYGGGAEVAIYRGGLEKMPEWKLRDVIGHGYTRELQKQGFKVGDVIIAAGNKPPQENPAAPQSQSAMPARGVELG